MIISHCNNCADKVNYVDNFIIPERDEINAHRCKKCGNYIMFYKNDKPFIDNQEVQSKVAKKEKREAKPKDATSKEAKSGITRYSDDVKQKVISLARQGKTLDEIVKTVNGPKSKAVARYIRKAGLTVKKE